MHNFLAVDNFKFNYLKSTIIAWFKEYAAFIHLFVGLKPTGRLPTLRTLGILNT